MLSSTMKIARAIKKKVIRERTMSLAEMNFINWITRAEMVTKSINIAGKRV